jgi:hypothetical protein
MTESRLGPLSLGRRTVELTTSKAVGVLTPGHQLFLPDS